MIRLAILGGGIGAQHHAAYQALPEFDVTHIVDQDAARRTALTAGGVIGLEKIEDALAADVDLIDICLPPHLHAPVAIAGLEAGKDVICEKPLATSMAQVAQMEAAQQRTGRRIFPVFQYRFGRAFDQLRALRAAGLLGAARAAALETHWNRGADYYAVPWRGTWAGEQGGAVLGHAIHAHDLLSHFMAPVRVVTAHLGTLVNPIETDDTAALLFQLEGGALATSSVTLGAAQDETRIRLVYEHLTATSRTNPYAPGDAEWSFVARSPDAQARVDDVVAQIHPAPSGFAGFLSHVAAALSGKPTDAVSFADGATSVALVTAIYASHRSGRSQSLPIPSDHRLYDGWQP